MSLDKRNARNILQFRKILRAYIVGVLFSVTITDSKSGRNCRIKAFYLS